MAHDALQEGILQRYSMILFESRRNSYKESYAEQVMHV